MPVMNPGKSLMYKGGLVTLPKFFAFFVGGVEVAAGNYRRVLVQESQWGISDDVLYLLEDIEVSIPDADWGAVDSVKLMSLSEGGAVLVEWTGAEFSLVFADGRPVGAAGVISGRGVFLKGGPTNGLSIQIP